MAAGGAQRCTWARQEMEVRIPTRNPVHGAELFDVLPNKTTDERPASIKLGALSALPLSGLLLWSMSLNPCSILEAQTCREMHCFTHTANV